MNDDDAATRARAVLARLREDAAESKWIHVAASMDAGKWRATLPAHTTRLLGAAPALIRLAEAVARLAADGDEWWYYRAADHDDGTPSCIGCGQLDWRPDALNAGHDSDCPALAIDAALADLAALGDDAGGEVGA